MCLTIFECHANFTFLTFHFDPWRIGFLFMSESLCRYHHRICTTGPSQRICPKTSKSMWEPGRSYIILPYHSNPLAYLLISSNVAQIDWKIRLDSLQDTGYEGNWIALGIDELVFSLEDVDPIVHIQGHPLPVWWHLETRPHRFLGQNGKNILHPVTWQRKTDFLDKSMNSKWTKYNTANKILRNICCLHPS